MGYTQFHQTSVSRIYSPLVDFLEKKHLTSWELRTSWAHRRQAGRHLSATHHATWIKLGYHLTGFLVTKYEDTHWKDLECIYIYIYNDTVGEEIIRIRMGVDSCLNKPSILSEVESST